MSVAHVVEIDQAVIFQTERHIQTNILVKTLVWALETIKRILPLQFQNRFVRITILSLNFNT